MEISASPQHEHRHEGHVESGIDADLRLIAEKQQALMRACAAEIDQVLRKYGVKLEVTMPVIELRPVSG